MDADAVIVGHREDFHILLQALQVTATKWQRMQVIL